MTRHLQPKDRKKWKQNKAQLVLPGAVEKLLDKHPIVLLMKDLQRQALKYVLQDKDLSNDKMFLVNSIL